MRKEGHSTAPAPKSSASARPRGASQIVGKIEAPILIEPATPSYCRVYPMAVCRASLIAYGKWVLFTSGAAARGATA